VDGGSRRDRRRLDGGRPVPQRLPVEGDVLRGGGRGLGGPRGPAPSSLSQRPSAASCRPPTRSVRARRLFSARLRRRPAARCPTSRPCS
jgi:hypothetical protein